MEFAVSIPDRNRNATQAIEHPLHQLRKGRHIGPKHLMPNPHERQGNKKYAWKTSPRLPHSKGRDK